MDADFPPDRATGKEATSPAAKTDGALVCMNWKEAEILVSEWRGEWWWWVPQSDPTTAYQVHLDGTSTVKPDGASLDKAGIWSDACGEEVEPPVRPVQSHVGARKQLQEKACPSRCGQLQPWGPQLLGRSRALYPQPLLLPLVVRIGIASPVRSWSQTIGNRKWLLR